METAGRPLDKTEDRARLRRGLISAPFTEARSILFYRVSQCSYAVVGAFHLTVLTRDDIAQ